jgi:hypothetical protein
LKLLNKDTKGKVGSCGREEGEGVLGEMTGMDEEAVTEAVREEDEDAEIAASTPTMFFGISSSFCGIRYRRT